MRGVFPTDPVTQYLKHKGFTPEVAYFEGSGFVMGCRVGFEDFAWVYRVEEGMLTVCDFMAVQAPPGQGSSRAVLQFVSLIQQIGRDVRGLRCARGRFISPLGDDDAKQRRERLVDVLLAKGAYWEVMEGESWLVYAFGA